MPAAKEPVYRLVFGEVAAPRLIQRFATCAPRSRRDAHVAGVGPEAIIGPQRNNRFTLGRRGFNLGGTTRANCLGRPAPSERISQLKPTGNTQRLNRFRRRAKSRCGGRLRRWARRVLAARSPTWSQRNPARAFWQHSHETGRKTTVMASRTIDRRRATPYLFGCVVPKLYRCGAMTYNARAAAIGHARPTSPARWEASCFVVGRFAR